MYDPVRCPRCKQPPVIFQAEDNDKYYVECVICRGEDNIETNYLCTDDHDTITGAITEWNERFSA